MKSSAPLDLDTPQASTSALSRSGGARVLVTGAEGPAGRAVRRALATDPSTSIFGVDAPRGATEDYVDAVLAHCANWGIDVVVPTKDHELRPLARAADRFARLGVRVLVAPDAVLARIIDRVTLAATVESVARVARTEYLCLTNAASWEYPVIVKSRESGLSRGVRLVEGATALLDLPVDSRTIVQEFLPGTEVTVDVLCTSSGRALAAVPQLRQHLDSGVGVAVSTVRDEGLEDFARRVVERLGVPFVSRLKIRLDADGEPVLLEVAARACSSLALTAAAGVNMVRRAVDDLRGSAHSEVPRHLEDSEIHLLPDASDAPRRGVGDLVALTSSAA